MSTHLLAAFLVAALAGACGGHKTVHRVEQPSLETVAPEATTGQGLGTSAVPGFLRACQVQAAASGLVEISCDQHQLVEFRKLDGAGPQGGDEDLDELMQILEARFGELAEERSDSKIDDAAIRLSQFVHRGDGGVHGVAATIGNVEGHYWGMACYRKGAPVSEDFCGDALATAARAGGLAHVEARPLQDFAEGRLAVADGCESNPGRGIHCATGKLSWSAADVDASSLRAETIANLQEMARTEKVKLVSTKRSCALLGKDAECEWVRLHNAAAGEELNFVLATGGDQERLVVCTFPGPMPPKSLLPEPCAQALVVKDP